MKLTLPARYRSVLSVLLPLVFATALQWLLWPVIRRTPWVFFYPSVYIASWFGGWRAGVAMTVLSVIAAYAMFMSHNVLTGQWVIPVVIFVSMGVLFSFGHERMRRAENHLRVLFEQSSDAIVLANPTGRFVDVNESACRMLGYTRQELLDKHVIDLILSTEIQRLHQLRARQLGGDMEFSEWMLIRKDGSEFPAEISSKFLPGGLWQASVRDLSVRKANEEVLRQTQAELFEAQRLGKIGSWEWDVQTQSLKWSPELFRIYDLDPAGPTPRADELEKHYAPQSRQERAAALNQALQTGLPYAAERELVLPSGEHRWIHAIVESASDDAGHVVKLRGTAQDITERKHFEMELLRSRSQLREMASHREVELEQERKHIAREIHDELGQLLTGLKMDLALLEMRGPVTPAAHHTINDMRHLVERTFQVVRSVSTSLRPAVLDLGLAPALQWLVEDFPLRWSIDCTLNIEGAEQALGEAMSTAIFRVVQESLTNVSRHAQASQVGITLRYEPHLVQVKVQDNGHGFDVHAGIQPTGFGLLGMRERVLALGGRFNIESGPQGTTVAIEVPTGLDLSASG